MASQCAFAGNIAVAPELGFTAAGKAFVRFVVAENLGHKGADGAWVEDPAIFWPVTAWGDIAEHVSADYKKGDRVMVLGRLRNNVWTDDEDKKRSRIEVTADEVGASSKFARVRMARIQRADADGTPPAAPLDFGQFAAPVEGPAAVSTGEPPF